MSTAVLPLFYVKHGSLLIYRCRSCSWMYAPSRLHTTRDARMLKLAQHAAEQHQAGPLALVAQ